MLRHSAGRRGLELPSDGLFKLTDVLATHKLQRLKATPSEVVQVVDESDKQRFEVVGVGSNMKIRATQGHSMSGIQNKEFQTRLDVTDVPDILYHGTFSWLYASIVERGLLAGGPHRSRQDIHFVGADPTGPTSSTNIISGMRSSSDIVLQVDGPQAARDGITFFLSSKEVILNPGPSPSARIVQLFTLA